MSTPSTRGRRASRGRRWPLAACQLASPGWPALVSPGVAPMLPWTWTRQLFPPFDPARGYVLKRRASLADVAPASNEKRETVVQNYDRGMCHGTAKYRLSIGILRYLGFWGKDANGEGKAQKAKRDG
eukprot:201713-Prorocentrum_minimum.AAC.4